MFAFVGSNHYKTKRSIQMKPSEMVSLYYSRWQNHKERPNRFKNNGYIWSKKRCIDKLKLNKLKDYQGLISLL